MTPIMGAEVLDALERELVAWGSYVAGGREVAGYPVMSVIHPNWTPPAKGMPAKLPMRPREYIRERRVDIVVRRMSRKLQDALAVRYVRRMPYAEQAMALGCQPGTVDARVREAKRQLQTVLRVIANR
jgi:hypothetical protein